MAFWVICFYPPLNNRVENNLAVHTLGCRLNALESDEIRHAAQEAGLREATIINSCAVTQEALRQTRQQIRRAGRANPEQPLIVTGCAVHSDQASLRAMPEITHIIGNVEKRDTATYRQIIESKSNDTAQIIASDIMAKHTSPPPMRAPHSSRMRAAVEIQTGCDHRCTFCVIPQGRGNARSVCKEQVAERIEHLLGQGAQEIVLTGVDITSWGADLGASGLGVLIAYILERCPHLPRLRLSSVDAVELDAALLAMIIDEPRLMPHLHLSLQAGDDMILKRMKRRHSREDAVSFCAELRTRRPDIVFGADLIAGFPTESAAMFENSRRLIADCGLVWLHIFPFSPRPDTPAARMPQLPRDVIKARAAILRDEGDKARRTWLKAQKGRKLTMLVESAHRGRSDQFAQIQLIPPAPAALHGSIATAHIRGHSKTALIGEIIP